MPPWISRLEVRATALLLSFLSACGPRDLAENVEHAGPIAGPFPVSRFFTASGFMGDGMLPGFLLADVDEQCKPRPVDAVGNCYRFSYNVGEQKWAGVYWQHPANNWGALPGRTIATRFSHVRFSAAAEYRIVLPEGRGTGESCAQSTDCRNALTCEGGVCLPAGTTMPGERCLISAECAGAAQCIGQICGVAGSSDIGGPCGSGDDQQCADGLACGIVDNVFQCVPEGALDVGAHCTSRNECRSGLYCVQDACQPKTLIRQVTFMVGGLNFPPTREDLKFSDQVSVPYFPATDQDPDSLVPDFQQFRLDLATTPEFSTLLGAFMWAAPFPNIDLIVSEGPKPYLADVEKPLLLYLDDIFFETQ